MTSLASDRLNGLDNGVGFKPPCKAVAITNIVLSGQQTVGGVALVSGDRCLVMGQTSAIDNGIYDVSTGSWTRSLDFDGPRDAVTGTVVFVYGMSTCYRLTTTDNPINFGSSSITFATALFSDLSGATFLQLGAGAVSRSAQAKMRDIICVLDFGATGDGATDDTAAFVSALLAASGKALYVPDPSAGYRITSTLTVPSNTRIYGDGKMSTRIFLDAATTLLTLKDGTALERLYLDGNSKAGILVNFTGTDGQQTILSCKITDSDIGVGGGCINFAATTAGAGLRCIDVLCYQKNGASGSGKYAVWNQDAAQAQAQPRHFIGFETGGQASFSLGGCNSWYVLGGFISDVAFSVNSRVFNMVGARWGSPLPTITIKGGQHNIVGNDIFPALILDVGVGGCTIGPNAYNNGVPTDNSGGSLGGNLIYHWNESYVPVLGATTGTAPAIGNGTITGRFSRNGDQVTVTVQIVAGTTTTFGNGGILNVSLPPKAPNNFNSPQPCGTAYVIDASANDYYFGVMQINNGTNVAEFRREGGPTAGTQPAFIFNAPATWASTDVFRATFTYCVGP